LGSKFNHHHSRAFRRRPAESITKSTMPARDLKGIALMALAGIWATVQWTIGGHLQSLQWPYYRGCAVASGLIAIAIIMAMTFQGGKSMEVDKVGWVLLRGFSGGVVWFVPGTIASTIISAGDINSLASVNVIIAALLGWAFLGEPLPRRVIVALGCCVVGATLIAKPSFLFGASDMAGGLQWLGYLMAILSGSGQGMVMVLSRKAAGVSPWWQTSSALAQRSLACWILLLNGQLNDPSLEPLTTAPWQAAGWFMSIVCITFLNNFTVSAGARLCPASASAVVVNSSGMVSGYLTQLAFYGKVPSMLTLGGSLLMLVAVSLVASGRESPNVKGSAPEIDNERGIERSSNGVQIPSGRESPKVEEGAPDVDNGRNIERGSKGMQIPSGRESPTVKESAAEVDNGCDIERGNNGMHLPTLLTSFPRSQSRGSVFQA